MTTTTGRCLCGSVTFSFTGEPSGTDYCHCESCRRTCGAPVAAFIEVPRANFAFTSVEPKIHESSPGIRRLFCDTCGSPIAYDADWDKRDIHLYLALLDDPAPHAPTKHVFTAEQIPWFDVKDDLPRHPGSETGWEKGS